MSTGAYHAAGVNAQGCDAWLEGLRSTLPAIGGFAALFPIGSAIRGMSDPCLVSCTDGVGTKVLIARALQEYGGIGRDCVAMVLNDMICCGARPLFFLDYLAVGAFDRSQADAILKGLKSACDEAQCPIIGGETAELPGLLAKGDFDVCGFAVGIVDRARVIDGARCAAGDAIIGLPSSGIHSNGLSLARRVLSDYETNRDLARELLTPTALYVAPVLAALDSGLEVHGIAHITGGGLPGNVSRVTPSTVDAVLDSNAWDVHSIFRLIADRGGIGPRDLFETFNMGIGLCLVAPKHSAAAALQQLASLGARRIGSLVPGTGRVRIDGMEFA